MPEGRYNTHTHTQRYPNKPPCFHLPSLPTAQTWFSNLCLLLCPFQEGLSALSGSSSLERPQKLLCGWERTGGPGVAENMKLASDINDFDHIFRIWGLIKMESSRAATQVVRQAGRVLSQILNQLFGETAYVKPPKTPSIKS